MYNRVELTKAESNVAKYIAAGFTKKEIAMITFKSVFTIENQVRMIFEKAG